MYICLLRNDAYFPCHACSFLVCTGLTGNQYIPEYRVESTQSRSVKHFGETCIRIDQSDLGSHKTWVQITFERNEKMDSNKKQQVYNGNQLSFPIAPETSHFPEIKNDRRCGVGGNDTHPLVDMSDFGCGVQSPRKVLTDRGKQVTRRCGHDVEKGTFSETKSLLFKDTGGEYGKSSQVVDITHPFEEINQSALFSNDLEPESNILSCHLEEKNRTTAVTVEHICQPNDGLCDTQTISSLNSATCPRQCLENYDDNVLDEIKGRTLFKHLEFDKVYEQKLNKKSLFQDLKTLPHSNSFTFRDEAKHCSADPKTKRPTLKKDFSFPTLPNETLHHDVHSPSCRLNCTPKICSPTSADTAEDAKYPMNITHDSLLLSANSITFLTAQSKSNVEADKGKIRSLTLKSTQHSAQENKSSPSQNICSTKNQTNDFSSADFIADDHTRRINNIHALPTFSGVVLSPADKDVNMENNAEEAISFNSGINSGARLENKLAKNIKNCNLEIESDISPHHVCHKNHNLCYESAKGNDNKALSLEQTATDKKRTLQSEDGPLRSAESISLIDDCGGEPDLMHKDLVTVLEDATSKDSSGMLGKDSKQKRDAVVSLPSLFSHSRDSRCRQMETLHVHEVYKQIAPQCDHVRHKAWPRVKRFLKDLCPGSLVADVGCGNGRYLNVNKSILKIGSDVCQPFLEQAKDQGHEIMMADNTALPYRDATFDAAISIGVIHHFASLERRVKALSELARILSPGGKLMVYVWAFEQMHRKFESQDVLVPWVKPEGKGTLSRTGMRRELLSSGTDHASISSIGSSASDEESSADPSRRFERQKDDNSFSRRSSRLSSVDDPSADDDNSTSQSDDHRAKQKFGVFDRRDSSTKRRSNGDITKGIEEIGEGDTVFHENSFSEERGLGENQDPSKPFSKWPGQLVSECRKLGKFLRSLSIKSELHSSEDGCDDLGGSLPGDDDLRVDRNFLQPQSRGSNAEKEDAQRCGIHKIQQVSKAVSDTNLHVLGNTLTGEKICPDSDDQRRKGTETHDKTKMFMNKTNSESRINSGECHCDVYVNENANQTNVATSYHNVPLATHSPVYSSAIGRLDQNALSKNGNHFVHSGTLTQARQLGCSGSDKVMERHNSDNNSLTSLQLSTPAIISSSADESDSTSSGNQDGLVSKPESYSISRATTKFECSSDSVGLVSSPNKSKNPDCLSSHSINTELNGADTDKSSFNPTESKCFFTIGSPGQVNTRLGQEDGTPAETLPDPCVSRNNSILQTPSLGKRQNLTSCDNKVQRCDIFEYNRLDVDNSSHPFRPPLQISTSNTSIEVNFGASDLADNTDGLDSDSVYSLEQGNISSCENVPRVHSDTEKFASLKSVKPNNMPTAFGTDKTSNFFHGTESTSQDDSLTPHDHETEERHFKCSLGESNNPRATSTVRQTFKNIFTKLADVFSLRPVTGYKAFGSYQDGKYAKNPLMESDSSENETSLSNISTHSSCFPTSIYKVGWEKSPVPNASTKRDETLLQDPFGIIEAPKGRPAQRESRANDKLYNFNNQYQKHEGIHPVSANEDPCEKLKGNNLVSSKKFSHSHGDAIRSTVEKERVVQTLAQKWSSIINKGKTFTPSKQKEVQRYSHVNLSSSDSEEERWPAAGSGNQKEMEHKFKSPSKVMTKRPSSLDFTKKRIRGKGRKPGFLGSERVKSHKDNKLTLADAMTLIGDGASEHSIVKRLNPSAQTIFAEMKRMNFAIRQFPKSSLDSDSNDDQVKPIPMGCTEASTQTPDKPLTDKIRNDKKRYPRRRRFSDSVTSQTIRSKRGRGIVKLHEEISNADRNTNKRCFPLPARRHVSKDLGMSFDSTYARYTGVQNQLQTVDLFTPPFSGDPSKQSNESLEKFENASNNAIGTQTTPAPQLVKLRKTLTRSTESEGNCSNDSARVPHTGVANPKITQTEEVQNDICNEILAQLDSIIDHVEANKSNSYSEAMSKTTKAIDKNQSASNNSHAHFNTSVLTSMNKEANGVSASTAPNREENNLNVCAEESKADNSLSRYYHVFKKGELDQLITDHVPSLRVVETFYDHANWCIVAQKL